MRTLAPALATVMLSPQRQPAWQVLAYDVLSSGAPTMSAIIAGSATSAFQLNLTPYVHGGVTVEEPGDKRAAHITFTVSDHLGSFDPASGTYATYMQQHQVVHITAGDTTVPTSQYVGLFLGHVRGQVGFTIDRQALRYETTLSCYNRRAVPRYLKRRFTSQSYGNAVDFATICLDVARQEMSLSGTELTRFPGVLGQLTQFSTNTIADLSPLEALDKILEALGLVCDFDGDGRLRVYSRDLRRAPDKVFANLNLIASIEHPQADTETYNSVKIIGLDKNITELEQPEQALARATIPVGFWRPMHTVDVWWSNDRSLRARHTVLSIESSVNNSLILGLGTESYTETSEYGGRISIGIIGFLLSLIALIGVTLLAGAYLPDALNLTAVQTISVGRVIQSLTIQLALMTVATQSSGVYEVRGVPILPVFQEISATLTVDGTPDYLVNQKEITNDWVSTQEHLLALALVELIFEVAQSSPRNVSLVDDLTLEVGDMIQIPLGAAPLRLWVESLRRTMTRDQVPLLDITGFKVPEGAF